MLVAEDLGRMHEVDLKMMRQRVEGLEIVAYNFILPVAPLVRAWQRACSMHR
jgi:hypothetical protein